MTVLKQFDSGSSQWVPIVTGVAGPTGPTGPTGVTGATGPTGTVSLDSPTFTGTPTLPTGTIATTQTAGNSTTAVATTAFVTTADNLKAPLASPAFTGTPTAPTAAAATNTTQLATTEFVRTEVANLVASAPAALDTLDELAAALGDDVNFATTTATAIGSKAPLISPSFTTPALGVATATSVNGTTIPTSKTLVVTTDKLSALAATTSAELAGVISDETGSGALVFGTSPTLTTPVLGVATGTSFNSITGLSSTTPVVNGTAAVGVGTTTARGDHVHPTDTSRAPLASPALTGTPTAPTASAGTNTTQLATTAFVTTADNLKANLSGATFTGIVTTGSNPAFSAYPAVNYGTSGTSVVYHTATLFNTGSHFNTSNYRFTAPVAGVYHFSLNLNVYNVSTGDYYMPALFKNGSGIHYGDRQYGLGATDTNANVSAAIYLSAGDYVQPYCVSSAGSYNFSGGSVWNSFTGVFLG